VILWWCGVLNSDRWCDSSGDVVYLIVTGGVTVMVGGVLTSGRWCDSSDQWCTY
jgi:hypothetical protein